MISGPADTAAGREGTGNAREIKGCIRTRGKEKEEMKKTWKKILLPLFALCFILAVGILAGNRAEAATVVSGSSGNTKWTLSDSGVLTISGTGEMCSRYYMKRNSNDKDWCDYNVTRIVIKEGITSVSDSAFYDCKLLETVSLPSTLTSIGSYSFEDCISLKKIVIPDKVTRIAYGAFNGCTSLSSVTLPANLQQIGSLAFSGCSNLTKISLPNKLKIIDDYAFYECPLHVIIIPSSVTVIGGEAFTGGGKYSRVIFKGNAPSMESGGSFPFDVPSSYSVNNNGVSPLYIYHLASASGWDINDINDKYSVTGDAYLKTYRKASITSQPKAASAVAGDRVTFSVKATATEASHLLYQWQYSTNDGKTWKDWSGKTTASVSVKASDANNGTLYRCVVDVLERGLLPAYSSGAKLTVTAVAKPVITAQPKSVTAVKGNTATFSVTATGTGLTYQWQYSKDNGTTWNNWSGKTSSSVTANAGNNSGWLYRCVVRNAGGTVYSSAAKLTVNNVTKPVITAQPKNTSAVKGSTATFSVTATGTGLTYQWQYSKDDGATWNTWSGKTASSVTANAVNNSGWLYRCIVKNAAGSVTSSSAKLTVISAPVIKTQPKAVTAVKGDTATFSVTATGTGLTYQWQYSKDNGATWNTWSGETSSSVTANARNNSGWLYRCIVKNDAGSVISSAAKLTVTVG